MDYFDLYQVWHIDSREHYDAAVAEGSMVEGIQKAMAKASLGTPGLQRMIHRRKS